MSKTISIAACLLLVFAAVFAGSVTSAQKKPDQKTIKALVTEYFEEGQTEDRRGEISTELQEGSTGFVRNTIKPFMKAEGTRGEAIALCSRLGLLKSDEMAMR